MSDTLKFSIVPKDRMDNSFDNAHFISNVNAVLDYIENIFGGKDDVCGLKASTTGNTEISFSVNSDGVGADVEQEIANYIFSAFVQFSQIKHHLGGCRAEKCEIKDETLVIYNSRLESLSVNREMAAFYFGNSKLDGLLSTLYNSITGKSNSFITITVSYKDYALRLSPEDLSPLTKKVVDLADEYSESIITYLGVKRVDLDCNGQWEFRMNGSIIRVYIAESQRANLRDIVQRCALGGKYLCVELTLYYKLDLLGRPIDGTRKYEVTKVMGDPVDDIEDVEIASFKIDQQVAECSSSGVYCGGAKAAGERQLSLFV